MTYDHNTISGTEVNTNTQEKPLTIIRAIKNKDNPYFQLNRHALNNKNLSLESKGLHCYLMSMPDDWVFHMTELQTHSTNGRDAHASAVKELQKAGYVFRNKTVLPNGKFGRWEFLVFETPEFLDDYLKSRNDAGLTPVTENPFPVDSPLTGKPLTENPQLLNTNNTNNDLFVHNHKKTNNKELEREAVVVSDEEFVERHMALWKLDEGEKNKIYLNNKTPDIKIAIEYTEQNAKYSKRSFLIQCLLEGWHKKGGKPSPQIDDSKSVEKIINQVETSSQQAKASLESGFGSKSLSEIRAKLPKYLKKENLGVRAHAKA